MQYIKLNDNNNHLSLGNLFNIIKKIALNKSSAIQGELFCTLFNIDNISDTTVGNYATGYRSIGNDYKQIYINYKKHYLNDKTILIPTINNLLSQIDSYRYQYDNINEINHNPTLKKLCQLTHTLVKNDLYVPQSLKKELLNYLKKENYYEFITNVLFFIILEKQQPLYESDLVNETLEEILKNTNMSINDLKNYLEIVFKEGISLVPSLKKLAANSNPYALHELGNLEYNGIISGTPNYLNAYNYYQKAAAYNHPTACWMIAHIILNEKISILNDEDLNTAWAYLKKAYDLKSISAINTMGLCYLNGKTLDKKKDTNKAIKYFLDAANKKYVYAYNNLGKIYEEKDDYQNAIKYYTLSANEENSWACNKLGLFYYDGKYIKKDIKKAYEYFKIGASSPIQTRIPWNIYNLVKLFYLNGNTTIGIKKDIPKCLDMLDNIKDFPKVNELYLYCYYQLYLDTKDKKYIDKINYYLNILNDNLNPQIKKDIELELSNIYKEHLNITL